MRSFIHVGLARPLLFWDERLESRRELCLGSLLDGGAAIVGARRAGESGTMCLALVGGSHRVVVVCVVSVRTDAGRSLLCVARPGS